MQNGEFTYISNNLSLTQEYIRHVKQHGVFMCIMCTNGYERFADIMKSYGELGNRLSKGIRNLVMEHPLEHSWIYHSHHCNWRCTPINSVKSKRLCKQSCRNIGAAHRWVLDIFHLYQRSR